MPAPVPPPREWQSWKPWRQSQPAWARHEGNKRKPGLEINRPRRPTSIPSNELYLVGLFPAFCLLAHNVEHRVNKFCTLRSYGMHGSATCPLTTLTFCREFEGEESRGPVSSGLFCLPCLPISTFRPARRVMQKLLSHRGSQLRRAESWTSV